MLACHAPNAAAVVRGNDQYPSLGGKVLFYNLGRGVLVVTSLWGLPYSTGECHGTILGMHIHEGGCCQGNEQDPFAQAGAHYDTHGCEHPWHQGDLPPIFVNKGAAWSAVVTERFTLQEVLGKTVIVHGMPDDFTTQPSGDSGRKIGCGVICRA